MDLESLDIPMFKERYIDMTDPGILYVNISEILALADGIIFITPEYNSSITPALKNLIDIYGRHGFGDKPIAIASVSTGKRGGITAAMHLQQIVLSINGVLFPKILATGEVTETLDEKGNIINFSYKPIAEKFISGFINHVEAAQCTQSVLKRLTA